MQTLRLNWLHEYMHAHHTRSQPPPRATESISSSLFKRAKVAATGPEASDAMDQVAEEPHFSRRSSNSSGISGHSTSESCAASPASTAAVVSAEDRAELTTDVYMASALALLLPPMENGVLFCWVPFRLMLL